MTEAAIHADRARRLLLDLRAQTEATDELRLVAALLASAHALTAIALHLTSGAP